MRILNYTANLDLNTYENPHYEVELTCDCSFEELNTLYMKHTIDPTCQLYLSSEPDKTKSETTRITPKFGGMITLQNGRQVYIKKVIYSNPAVIVFWSDDVKTTSKCHEDDKFNGEFGLTLCVLKRFMSSEQLALLLEDWFVEEVNDLDYFDITLKDLRERDRLINKLS